MDAAEYAEHQSMHVVTALRETMVFANHAEHRLRCIREKLDFCEGEPGTSALIRMIRFEVDEALDAARDGGSDE